MSDKPREPDNINTGNDGAGGERAGLGARLATYIKTPSGKRLLIWVLTAVAVVFVAAVALEVAQEPFVCQYCHMVHGEWEAWQTGPHKEVSCESCHIGPGVLGYLFFLTDASVGLYETIAGDYPNPITTHVPRRECLACHEETNEKTLTVGGIKISHKELFTAGLRCTNCHAATGHPAKSNVFLQQATPQMESCAQRACHNGKDAPNECGTCHTQNPLTRANPDKAVARNHDIVVDFGTIKNIATCDACHKRQFCTDCHGLELPHSSAFIAEHFTFVDRLGPALCAKCHDNNPATPRGCFEGECHPQEPSR